MSSFRKLHSKNSKALIKVEHLLYQFKNKYIKDI